MLCACIKLSADDYVLGKPVADVRDLSVLIVEMASSMTEL